MEDSLGKTFAIICSVFVLIYLPLLCLALHTDNISQSKIDNSVTKFVDDVRSTGKITADKYEAFCREIDACEKLCKIEMIHSSQQSVENDELYFSYIEKSEILDTIYTVNVDYKMSKGDYLTVKVYNTEPTLATRLYRFLIPNYNESGKSLFVVYGGYILND